MTFFVCSLFHISLCVESIEILRWKIDGWFGNYTRLSYTESKSNDRRYSPWHSYSVIENPWHHIKTHNTKHQNLALLLSSSCSIFGIFDTLHTASSKFSSSDHYHSSVIIRGKCEKHYSKHVEHRTSFLMHKIEYP